MKKLLILLWAIAVMSAYATPIEVLSFASPEQEKRYHTLIEELRCLKCQNSSIAGSNAELAQDLRHKVYDLMVTQGMTDDEIKEWMLARYGDFVLYRPPVSAKTLILWGLPVILVVLGLGIVWLLLRRRSTTTSPALDADQQQLLDELKR
jgi:cytochrome c-type biogenesis protein CcmH